MSIEIVVPVPPVERAAPAALAATLPVEGARMLGIVDNAKHNARRLLEYLGERLVAAGVVDEVLVHTKPAPGKVMAVEPRSEMAARARLVISGVGD